jgi:hypothetical protein
VLRGTFGFKEEEVARSCRRLHNEELHNFYASPNIIRVIKSRRMRWKGHIAPMGKSLVGPKGKTQFRRHKIGGGITL